MTRKLKTTGITLLCLISAFFTMALPAQAQEWNEQDQAQQVQPYISSNPYAGGWSNCTWSAWQLALQHSSVALPSFGSAGSWFYNAAAMGYTVSSVPTAGSIVCWSHHVGYVSAVSDDGQSVYIIEGGYMGGYHEGWYTAYVSRSRQALLGYIYLW